MIFNHSTDGPSATRRISGERAILNERSCGYEDTFLSRLLVTPVAQSSCPLSTSPSAVTWPRQTVATRGSPGTRPREHKDRAAQASRAPAQPDSRSPAAGLREPSAGREQAGQASTSNPQTARERSLLPQCPTALVPTCRSAWSPEKEKAEFLSSPPLCLSSLIISNK